jgi:hypothetical protein
MNYETWSAGGGGGWGGSDGWAGIEGAGGQCIHEKHPVLVVIEDRLTTVPSAHRVVNRPRILHPKLSSHNPRWRLLRLAPMSRGNGEVRIV